MAPLPVVAMQDVGERRGRVVCKDDGDSTVASKSKTLAGILRKQLWIFYRRPEHPWVQPVHPADVSASKAVKRSLCQLRSTDGQLLVLREINVQKAR